MRTLTRIEEEDSDEVSDEEDSGTIIEEEKTGSEETIITITEIEKIMRTKNAFLSNMKNLKNKKNLK